MKKYWVRNLACLTAFAVMAPLSLLAQDDKGEKEEKGEKETRNRVQNVIITQKGDKKEKLVVEINGDKVTINGVPADEFSKNNKDVHVNINSLRDVESLSMLRSPKGGAWSFNGDHNMVMSMGSENRAMLGVTTEKNADGAEIQSITEGGAAEKAGLKEKDIITKIDDQKISIPDDLSAAIRKHKPGEKVSITYLRDKKEMKASAELTKWKGISTYSFSPGQGFNLNMDDFKFDKIMPKVEEFRRMPSDRMSWSGSTPKLGLSVQDTDNGKGVKVVNVDEESNAAKAGIREDDIITHLDDKAVNNVDEISALLKEKKANPTVRFQLTRNGKSQNIEVKMPRKIKTTNL